MEHSKEILAVGSIAYDSIKTPKGNRKRILGGSCTYFSVAASSYTNIQIIGIVGNDFDNESWDIFKKYNINTQNVEIANGKTFSWGGAYNNDYSKRETLFTDLGVFENFAPNINSNIENPILYLGNIQPQLQLDVISKTKNPYLIAADSMNLWIDLFPDEVRKLISKVDLFMLNDEEARQLMNKDNLDEIANDLLAMGPEIVVIKKGGEGSLLAYKNKKINISVVPDTPIYDPTGAGDSFAGGMLGYIAVNGINNPENAVIHGTAVASFTVSGFGLENLYKLNESTLNSKIQQIKIQ